MLSQVSPFHSPCRMQVGRGQPSAMKLKCIPVPRTWANIQPRRSYDSYPSSGGEREGGEQKIPFSPSPLRTTSERTRRGDGGMIFPRARGCAGSRRLCRAPKMMRYFAPVLPILASSAKTRNPFLLPAETSRSKNAAWLLFQEVGESHILRRACNKSV